MKKMLIGFLFFIPLVTIVTTSLFAQDRPINKTDLLSSAKLIDLQFTDPEIDSLFNDVIDNLANYKAMHALSLNNNTPLSLWHTAILPGMNYDDEIDICVGLDMSGSIGDSPSGISASSPISLSAMSSKDT